MLAVKWAGSGAAFKLDVERDEESKIMAKVLV